MSGAGQSSAVTGPTGTLDKLSEYPLSSSKLTTTLRDLSISSTVGVYSRLTALGNLKFRVFINLDPFDSCKVTLSSPLASSILSVCSSQNRPELPDLP